MTQGKPIVSVVVPTHDGGQMLLECLDYVDACRPGLELIIVDNASRDESVDKAIERFPQARVIKNDANYGFARASNQGAEIAVGEFVLFLNNDAFIDPDNLERLVRAAMSDAAGAAWQPVNFSLDGEIEFAGDMFTWWGFFLHLQEAPQGSELRSVFSTKAACMLVRSGAFEEVGGFNDDYFAYFEEADFCWRARLAGWEIRVVPDACVEHIGGRTAKRVFSPAEIRYLSYRNRLRATLANASRPSLARILPKHAVGCLASAMIFLVTGRLRSAAAIVAAVSWPLFHHGTVRAERQRAQQSRILQDARVLRRELRGELTPAVVWQHLKHHGYRWERLTDD